MESMNVRRTLVGAAVSAALGVVAGPADALRYGGTFDPITFSGSYVINVDPDCLVGDGWKPNDGGPINPGDATCSVILESASALIASTLPDTINGTVIFAPPELNLPEVLGVNVVGGTVALNAFDTELLSWVSSDFGFDGSMFIQFVSGGMSYDPYTCGGDVPPTGVNLYVGNSEPSCDSAPNDTADFISINAIPEPGTAGLLLTALGGAWLARRRRAKAAG